jgi:hypothetical protein
MLRSAKRLTGVRSIQISNSAGWLWSAEPSGHRAPP